MKNTRSNQNSDVSGASDIQTPVRGVTARCLAAGLILAAGAAQAAVLNSQELAANFGSVNQNAVFGPGIGPNGNNSCAPTANMNAFTFLQNTYQGVYGNDGLGNPALQGGQGSWTGAAIQLALNMGTTSAGGTSVAGWVNGTVGWFNTYAPGTTAYAGMGATVGGQPWLAAGAPTPAFLYSQLQANEGVELAIFPVAGIGHVLTLTGISWNNLAGGMNYGGTDTMSLNTIDPGNPGVNTALSFNPGTLTINGGAYNGYTLGIAIAQSPVPETSTTIAGGLTMGLVLLVVLRKNRTAAAPAV